MHDKAIRPGLRVIYGGKLGAPPKGPPAPGSVSGAALDALNRIVQARREGKSWTATELRRELAKLQEP